uniref:PPIase cyclophilin-type domain-containing protein n=1 Tax=Mesocestoides corti TaxID=53468 RepID=A0A5K3F255_MESCO
MMQNCLTRRPCTSLSTQFYTMGESEPEFNITISYAPHTTKSKNNNVLFSFELRTDAMVLMADTCDQQGNVFTTLRTYGPIRFLRILVQAGVVADASGRLRMSNSQIGILESSAFPVSI